MAETMVEKVVRAVKEKLDADDDVYFSDDGDTCIIDGHVDLRALVKTAMEAMREPTLPMLHAGHDAANRSYELAKKVYGAMIDAALKEE